MLVFRTETGSVYELDQTGKRLRRIEGMTAPTPRMGADGEWKDFVDISAVVTGLSVLVIWRWVEEDGLPVAKSTWTSRVVETREVADKESETC
jgi:hypothetical protein